MVHIFPTLHSPLLQFSNNTICGDSVGSGDGRGGNSVVVVMVVVSMVVVSMVVVMMVVVVVVMVVMVW